jgi:peptidoglycan/xylan/chitin deacetylase (PgdA/CDA1 family)
MLQVANGPVALPSSAPTDVPILMYHVIGTAGPDTPYPGLWVAPVLFADQMSALAADGYTAVTLDAVLDSWDRRTALPQKPIVVSFDDGSFGQSRYAAPVLRGLGWPGVLNLVLHNLGSQGITAWRVRALVRDGWEIDSHSLTHPDLTTLDATALRHELTASRVEIHRLFGVPVNVFCYPAGRFDPRVERAVRAAGYRAATTELVGAATPDPAERYRLPRIRVAAGEPPATLLSSLRTARAQSQEP